MLRLTNRNPMTGPRPALALFAFLAAPGMLVAQGVPLGPEFRVNTGTIGNQRFPSVASDSAGNFVVAWDCIDYYPLGNGVFAQRSGSTGAPLGGQVRVGNFVALPGPKLPSVASDSAGNFVVAWQTYTLPAPPTDDIYAQLYFSTGSPLTAQFRVNTYTTNHQRDASVSSDSAGNFVIVWDSFAQDGSSYGVFGQRYANTGAPLGGEFRVNSYITVTQRDAAVARDGAGNFVVAWSSLGQDGQGYGVFAQRYSSTGTPLGGEFRVNSYTTNSQMIPSVASDAAGNFVVAWKSLGQDGFWDGVFAQRYAASGSPLGAEFQVNTYTAYNQYLPSVASDSAGNFVITWQSNNGQDGSDSGVFGQRYASTGAPLGGEFRVNTFTTNAQSVPSVASDSAGHFVVTWSSLQDPGGTTGIYAQRYSMIVPVELLGFRVE